MEGQRERDVTPARAFDASRVLFGPQLAFQRDRRKYKTAVCGRRGGKTTGVAADLIDTSLRRAGSTNFYIAKSRKNAKRILWGILKRMNEKEGAGGNPSESDLSMSFANGSRIVLAGANDRDAIEDLRGDGCALAVIDEAQMMPAYIESLVNDVLVPALMDFNGQLALVGTPGPIKVGYFCDAAHSPEWSHHSWTAFDNPHIEAKSGETPQSQLAAEMKRRGITTEDASIQREWFAKWLNDFKSLVFKYDAANNDYDELPKCKAKWEHVIGIDLGHDDADAIVVVAFNEERPDAYLVHEWVEAKQSITELAERLGPLAKRYEPLSTVWDTGGLGKKVADEVTRRIGIPLKAAEKTRKVEFIEILNDALRTKRLRVKASSQFADDALKVEWDWDKSTPDRLVISDRFHSDIADALLYAFRESLHWLHEEEGPPAPKPGTPEWAAAVDDDAEARAEREVLEEQREREEWAA